MILSIISKTECVIFGYLAYLYVFIVFSLFPSFSLFLSLSPSVPLSLPCLPLLLLMLTGRIMFHSWTNTSETNFHPLDSELSIPVSLQPRVGTKQWHDQALCEKANWAWYNLYCRYDITVQLDRKLFHVSPIVDLASYFSIRGILSLCVGMCIKQSILKIRAVPHWLKVIIHMSAISVVCIGWPPIKLMSINWIWHYKKLDNNWVVLHTWLNKER